MKALVSISPGGPETLEMRDVPVPEVGPGELLVRVLACAINFPDVLIIEDKYQVKPPRPFSPGCEFAGVVEAIGEGVQGWTVGDRLIATSTHNGLAEYTTVGIEDAIPFPRQGDLVEGAALLLTYGTTYHALVDRGGLSAGETLLVLGAAGGVGLAAIELGKLLGARVVAAVSSEEKAAVARAAGADHALVYGSGPFDKDASRKLAAEFKEAVGPDGADVIYDPVGGDYMEPALRSIAWEGRYLVIGFAAGIPRLPMNLSLLKSCDIRGVFWGAFAKRDPARNRGNLEWILNKWSAGHLRPRIDKIYAFEEGGEAIARLASRSAMGKVVVAIGDRHAC